MKKVFWTLFFLCLSNLFVFGAGEEEGSGLLTFLPFITIITLVTILIIKFKKPKKPKKPIICTKCGEVIEGVTNFCTKCGNSLKKGKAIASFILGCLGSLFSFTLLILSFTVFKDIDKYLAETIIFYSGIYVFPFVIVGFIFGIISRRKQKYSIAKIGIILSIIGIFLFLLMIVKILIQVR
jgi:O-antigen/teichoic acid export membrane protein